MAARFLLPAEAIQNAKDIKSVRSTWLDADLPIERKGDAIIVTYPKLEEGDVLRLN